MARSRSRRPRGQSRQERNDALMHERERIGEASSVPMSTRVLFVIYATVALVFFCLYGTFVATQYHELWLGLACSLAVAIPLLVASSFAVWLQKRDGSMVAAMLFGILFTMAGISSFLASWAIVLFAMFVVEGSPTIYYFMVFILLNIVLAFAVYFVLPFLVSALAISNTAVFLVFAYNFFKWSDLCLACPMFYTAVAMWAGWMAIMAALIFISFSRHVVLAKAGFVFMWLLSSAASILLVFSWYIYDGVFTFLAFTEPPYITRDYVIGPRFLIIVSLLIGGSSCAFFAAREAYRAYLIKSGQAVDLIDIKLQLLGTDGEANLEDDDAVGAAFDYAAAEAPVVQLESDEVIASDDDDGDDGSF